MKSPKIVILKREKRLFGMKKRMWEREKPKNHHTETRETAVWYEEYLGTPSKAVLAAEFEELWLEMSDQFTKPMELIRRFFGAYESLAEKVRTNFRKTATLVRNKVHWFSSGTLKASLRRAKLKFQLKSEEFTLLAEGNWGCKGEELEKFSQEYGKCWF